MGFIAGGYTVTYGAAALGQSAEGITLEHQAMLRQITGDSFAETEQNAVFRGMRAFGNLRLIEYDAAGVGAIMWPYGSTFLTQGVVGRLAVALAASLVLTAVAGTPAATLPASRTHLTSILAEGFPVSLLYAPDLREIPIRLRLYPNSSGVFGTQA